jgi:hypothetical protein
MDGIGSRTVNARIVNSFFLVAGLGCAGASLADPAAAGAITARTTPSGSVELSNLPSIDNAGTVIVAPEPAAPASVKPSTSKPALPAPAAAVAPAPQAGNEPKPDSTQAAAPDAGAAASSEDRTTSSDASLKDPREQYRDNMLQGAQDKPAANPSASRRYKMMDKATYQGTVLGNTPPASTMAPIAPQ